MRHFKARIMPNGLWCNRVKTNYMTISGMFIYTNPRASPIALFRSSAKAHACIPYNSIQFIFTRCMSYTSVWQTSLLPDKQIGSCLSSTSWRIAQDRESCSHRMETLKVIAWMAPTPLSCLAMRCLSTITTWDTPVEWHDQNTPTPCLAGLASHISMHTMNISQK